MGGADKEKGTPDWKETFVLRKQAAGGTGDSWAGGRVPALLGAGVAQPPSPCTQNQVCGKLPVGKPKLTEVCG